MIYFYYDEILKIIWVCWLRCEFVEYISVVCVWFRIFKGIIDLLLF